MKIFLEIIILVLAAIGALVVLGVIYVVIRYGIFGKDDDRGGFSNGSGVS